MENQGFRKKRLGNRIGNPQTPKGALKGKQNNYE